MADESVRQLKAIMFTDIKGYSSMMGRDEEGTVRLLLEHHELIRDVLRRHRGEERKTIGDAFMVLFDSAVNAVRCAVEIQTRLRDANATRPEKERVWIRIGIHLGDIIVEQDDIYGDGVNIAARVEPQAEPGGICITQQVFHQIEGKLDCRVIHVGRRELKNIRHAPELYHIMLGQIGAMAEGDAGPHTLSSGQAKVVEADSWPRAPWWKHALWWLCALPFPAWLATSPLGPKGLTPLRETFGDSTAFAVLFLAIVPAGLLAAAYFTSRLWARGRFSTWLHGRYFVAFPALCLLLFLYHYVVLQGRIEAAVMPVRTYSAISPALSDEITTSLARAVTGYINAYALDTLLVAYLALLVLLGYLFMPRAVGRPIFRWRDWLVLGYGLVVVGAASVAFSGPLRDAGYSPFVMVVGWALAAVAILRSARADGTPFSAGARSLASGVLLVAALSSLGSVTGFIMMLSALKEHFAEELRPLVWQQGMAEIDRGQGIASLLAAGLFVLAAVLLRKGLRWERTQSRASKVTDLGSAALCVVAAILPLATFPSATREMGRAFALPVAGMVPVALEPGSKASVYIDPSPAPLGRFDRRLYLAVAGKGFDAEYTVELLEGALAGGKECAPKLRASIGAADEGPLAPALCLTAIEARLACEVQGKRLLTPEEWDRAVGSKPVADPPRSPGDAPAVARLPIGEWTMRLVHGTPVFEVRGADAGPEIPSELTPAAYSTKVGFRCAYAYEP